MYSVFQGFRQAKSANGGSILSLSQFLILPQPPQKMKLASTVVKVDSLYIFYLNISYEDGQAVFVIFGLFICDFAYVRLINVIFGATYSLI